MNAFRDEWPNTAQSAEDRASTRERVTQQLEEQEAALYRECEFKRLERTLNGLYARQVAEGPSVLLRQRTQRLEAIMAALQGHPEALAG
ncbi:hypothetical protein ACIRLA_21205 [Streptomyces sp. NPDC102364]|uniref:hypothetical protein n=1 Tax=Streptomyces sp. NPDC102364 TaxID=3366161 RepID=UPI0038298542